MIEIHRGDISYSTRVNLLFDIIKNDYYWMLYKLMSVHDRLSSALMFLVASYVFMMGMYYVICNSLTIA